MATQNPPNYGTYVPSEFYSNFQTPEGALTYQQFNPQLYAEANPDVASDPGFTGTGTYRSDSAFPNPTAQEALYASYLNRFPDNPNQFLPDQTGFRAGEYSRSPEEIAALTAGEALSNLQGQLDQYINPETGELREELSGGDLPSLEEIKNQDEATLTGTLAGLKSRLQARGIGFKGEFSDLAGGEAYDKYKTAVGTKEGQVDAYGNPTAIGKQAELAETPVAPTGTTLDLDRIIAQTDEFLNKDNYDINKTEGQVTATTENAQTIGQQPKTDSQSFTADQSFESVKQQAMIAAKQQGITDTVQAQTDTVQKESTVQGQLEGLMKQFEGGKIPAYAAGAIRLAEQRLAASGMGASSMAGAAIVQAAMEASTPIAAADAQTYRSMQELNLNNRQQAEVLNAQMTLQLDLQNLNNEQQARVTNTSNRVQALFNDTASTNAAKQFNASSEQQNDQFFSSLFNNTSQFNAGQQNSMRQFNAGQQNTVKQFNATLQNSREQFNQKNAIIIDQANAVYRRQINTSNTAIANAENEYNTRTLFNISQTAQNNLLQEHRDQVNFSRVSSLNNQAFENQLALSSFAFDKDIELAADIAEGRLETRIIGAAIEAVFD